MVSVPQYAGDTRSKRALPVCTYFLGKNSCISVQAGNNMCLDLRLQSHVEFKAAPEVCEPDRCFSTYCLITRSANQDAPSVHGNLPELLWPANAISRSVAGACPCLAGLSLTCYAVCTSLIMHVWWHLGRGTGTPTRNACVSRQTNSSANSMNIQHT